MKYENGVKVYFDGGCKPNPGMMEIGVVIEDGPSFHKKLWYGTNNQAEWLALLWAMGLAASRELAEVEFIGDSKLVISQASGSWKCNKPELRDYLKDFNVRKKEFTRVHLTHVLRDSNLAGIYLETL